MLRAGSEAVSVLHELVGFVRCLFILHVLPFHIVAFQALDELVLVAPYASLQEVIRYALDGFAVHRFLKYWLQPLSRRIVELLCLRDACLDLARSHARASLANSLHVIIEQVLLLGLDFIHIQSSA